MELRLLCSSPAAFCTSHWKEVWMSLQNIQMGAHLVKWRQFNNAQSFMKTISWWGYIPRYTPGKYTCTGVGAADHLLKKGATYYSTRIKQLSLLEWEEWTRVVNSITETTRAGMVLLRVLLRKVSLNIQNSRLWGKTGSAGIRGIWLDNQTYGWPYRASTIMGLRRE